MTTTEIFYTYGSAVAVYMPTVFLLSRFLKEKNGWLAFVGFVLLLSSVYIAFGLHAMYNEQYILAGVQWGLFGCALYAFNTIWFKHGGNNA